MLTSDDRQWYLELIAQCEALPHDEEAQALREGLLKTLEPPAPPDAIAEHTEQLISDYAWALLSEDQAAIREAVKNMRLWLATVFAGELNSSGRPS